MNTGKEDGQVLLAAPERQEMCGEEHFLKQGKAQLSVYKLIELPQGISLVLSDNKELYYPCKNLKGSFSPGKH